MIIHCDGSFSGSERPFVWCGSAPFSWLHLPFSVIENGRTQESMVH